VPTTARYRSLCCAVSLVGIALAGCGPDVASSGGWPTGGETPAPVDGGATRSPTGAPLDLAMNNAKPDLAMTHSMPDLAMAPSKPDLAMTPSMPDLAMPPAMPDLAPPAAPAVPATLFGLHIQRADSTTPWPTSSFGAWRLWDSHVAWPSLEPSQGQWYWGALDNDVALAQQHNVDVLLPLGLSPTWASARPTEGSAYQPGNAAEPANINDWTNYVRTVATRYKGKVHYYEIWNEPNLTVFYTGTVDTMVTLAQAAYTTLKQVDPTIQVVCPSTTENDTTWIDSFWSKGGTAYTDIVGYHFYVWPDGPENMLAQINQVQQVMSSHGLSNKPLWDTEAGWQIANSTGGPVAGNGVLDDMTAAAFVARAYAVQWNAGVSRYFFYAWDDNQMGMTELDSTTVKPPGQALGVVYSWLSGASMGTCSTDGSGTWQCPITRSNGYAAWMLWNPNQTVNYPVPGNWGARTRRDLTGAKNTVTGQSTQSVGPSPILLENQ